MWPTLHTTHCPISRGQGFDTLLLRIEDTLLCDAVLHIATAFGWRHLRLDLVSMETTASCLRTACWQTQRIAIYVQSHIIRTRSISNISHFFYFLQWYCTTSQSITQSGNDGFCYSTAVPRTRDLLSFSMLECVLALCSCLLLSTATSLKVRQQRYCLFVSALRAATLEDPHTCIPLMHRMLSSSSYNFAEHRRVV